ncbi:N-acetyltransferase 9-like protein [Clytia hemisphaerica]|uniref:N-acetyltransferase 9-like protein n=1 Tax=Clytia hemisphaerica TaxID=252671 RepID=UPI0034D60149
MKINENTILFGNKLICVPYKKHHVEKYHQWMQDEELLEKTASEPLSLEKEYEMQKSWWIDDDKCTFILLSKLIFDNSPDNEIESMVGDVNLFFNNSDNKTEAEVEVMIAESSMRGQGLGKEAVNVMMFYGFKYLNVKLFSVKIGFDNVASIKLFTNLGFTEESRSEVFREVTLNLDCQSTDFQNIVKLVELNFEKSNYDNIFK